MRKICSILLSTLLLLSSSGIAYAQHFCGDYEMIAEITLGEKHLSCGMKMEVPGCEEGEEEHDCCDNEYTKVVVDDRFAKADFELKLNKTFVIAYTAVFVFQTEVVTTAKKLFFKDYSPPPLERDFQVLYESFLI